MVRKIEKRKSTKKIKTNITKKGEKKKLLMYYTCYWYWSCCL